MTCSKCDRDVWRAIVVYNAKDKAPPPGEKDNRNVRIIRFCPIHWDPIEALLPAAA